jgi:hypothetical protein
MPESTMITLPKTMPLVERISEVNRQLSDWLKSLEGFVCGRDALRLTKYEREAEKYSYHYIIDHRVSLITSNKSGLSFLKC